MRTKILLILFSVFLFTKGSSAQTSYDSLRSKAIRDIDNTVSILDKNIKSFSKIEKGNDSLGSVYDYLKGKELQLRSMKAYDDKLEKHVVWYYSNGEFIYAETTWIDPITNKLTFHEKYYVSKGTMIAWIKMNNDAADPNSNEFKTISTQLADYTTRLKAGAEK